MSYLTFHNTLLIIFFCYIDVHNNHANHSDDATYYVSPNTLIWRSANNYCRNVCGSSLASIHSVEDHTSAQSALEDHPLIEKLHVEMVWIGLYFSMWDNTWTWSDRSSFDYGNDSNQPTYNPWRANISITDYVPNQLACVMINISADYQWEIKTGDECNDGAALLCNHCDGTLTKYVLIDDQTATFAESNSICQDEMGTELISIHSAEDHVQSTGLCLYGSTSNGCWIGLNNQSDYAWSDGTNWDYATYTNAYPWSENDHDADCVLLSQENNYLWHTDDCFNTNHILCTVPSELCYAEQWQSLYDGDTWDFNACGVVESAAYEEKVMINTKKQWMNNNADLVIEYTFQMRQINIQSGSVAVIVYNWNESACGGYYIGMDDEWYKKKLFIKRYDHNTFDEIYSVYMDEMEGIASDTLHTLRVTITNGTCFDVMLNNIEYIYICINDTRPRTDVSGYIGLSVGNVLLHAQSFYVSGSPFEVDVNPSEIVSYLNECGEMGLEHTLDPISDIVAPRALCINITFMYDLYEDEGDAVVDYMTNSFVTVFEDIHCVSTVMDGDAVHVSLSDRTFIVSAELFVCVNNTNEVLTDYVQSIEGIFNETIHLECVSANETMETTYFEQNISSTGVRESDSWPTEIDVLIGGGMVLGGLCICIGAFMYRGTESKLKKKNEKRQREANRNVSLNVLPVSPDEVDEGWNIYTQMRSDKTAHSSYAKIVEEDAAVSWDEDESDAKHPHSCDTSKEYVESSSIKGSRSSNTTDAGIDDDELEYEDSETEYSLSSKSHSEIYNGRTEHITQDGDDENSTVDGIMGLLKALKTDTGSHQHSQQSQHSTASDLSDLEDHVVNTENFIG